MGKDIKVLLVYPNLEMKNLLPPAIGLLAACLRESGFDVNVFDTTYYSTESGNPDEKRKEFLQVRNYDAKDYGIDYKNTDVIEDFKKKVFQYQPDLVGVSVVEDTLPLGLRLIKGLGMKRPKTIFGGIHISYLGEKAFEYPEIDMICLGEGEEALVDLCQRLKNKEDFYDIKNIYVRKSDQIVKNPIRSLADLNKIPIPDYSFFEDRRFYSPMQGKMYRMLPIDFDRGCPFSCNFCSSPGYARWYKKQIGEHYFRKKSVAKILDEMKFLVKKHNIEFLYFNSDTFLIRKDDELKSLLFSIKKNIGLPFWSQTRVETITEYRMQLLKETGCARITIGLEHGNEEFRKKVVGKGFTNVQFIKAMEIINKVEIPISVNNIIGFPDETRDLIFDTIELNRQVQLDSISVFMFYPFQGTSLYNYCDQNDLIIDHVGSGTLLENSVIKNENITRDHLNRLLKTFCLYARFPKDRWPEIEEIEMGRPGSEKLFMKLSGEYNIKYF